MRRTIAVLGLVAVFGTQAIAQQKVNPVTINPGAGGGGFGGGGLNLTVPQYGPTVIYGAPYGYGYGQYPYYGSVGVVAPGWSAPIPGFGGYPGGFGYGGSGYDDPIYRQQQYALNASRYNLQTAQAERAYQEANYFRQQALATAMTNAQQAQAVREQFNVRSATPRSRTQAPRQAPTVPLDQLMTPEGAVRWPETSPKNADRERVDAAIAGLAKQFREAGKATVRSVNEARDALYAYGRPALAEVRQDRPATATVFKAFLNNLDASLTTMAR